MLTFLYGCLNVEIPTASSLPILNRFLDFFPTLHSLKWNTFVPILRDVCPGIGINYKIAKFV